MTEKDISSILLEPDYKPSENEEYMSPKMLEYFKQKLLAWKADVVRDSEHTLAQLEQEGGLREPDINDRASLETEHSLELRTRDRERKLINKIDEALQRIDRGDYGYCEETDEEIGVRRLDARPTATLCIEAQERHERKEKTRRDLADVHVD